MSITYNFLFLLYVEPENFVAGAHDGPDVRVFARYVLDSDLKYEHWSNQDEEAYLLGLYVADVGGEKHLVEYGPDDHGDYEAHLD